MFDSRFLTKKMTRVFAGLGFCLFAFHAIQIKKSFDSLVAESYQLTQNLAQSAEERLLRVFDASEDSFDLFATEIQKRGPLSPQLEKDYHLLFRSRLARFPFFSSFDLQDHTGKVIASSGQFPLQGESSANSNSIQIQRQIFNSRGQRIGSINATVSENLFSNLGVEGSDSISVINSAGLVLMQRGPESPFELSVLQKKSAGPLSEFSSFRWISHHPLILIASQDRHKALSLWHDEILMSGILFLLELILLSALTLSSWRYVQQHSRVYVQSHQMQQTTKEILSLSSGKLEIPYFEALTLSLSQVLQVDHVFVGELESTAPTSLRTVVHYGHRRFLPSFEYLLSHTINDHILKNKFCVYHQNAQNLFPKDQLLKDLDLQGYAGIVLHDSDGQPLGILTLMHGQKLNSSTDWQTLLEIFSWRAGAELERIQSQKRRALKTLLRVS